MVRSELARKVAETNPSIPSQVVEAAVDAMLGEITANLARGGRVEFRGFGSFASRIREARIGRNPKNGETVPVCQKQVPVFRASKRLLERLNSKA